MNIGLALEADDLIASLQLLAVVLHGLIGNLHTDRYDSCIRDPPFLPSSLPFPPFLASSLHPPSPLSLYVAVVVGTCC